MPELSDEEFFAILGVGSQRRNLEDNLAVAAEVSDMPALVNADGTRYAPRRTVAQSLNSPQPQRPVQDSV